MTSAEEGKRGRPRRRRNLHNWAPVAIMLVLLGGSASLLLFPARPPTSSETRWGSKANFVEAMSKAKVGWTTDDLLKALGEPDNRLWSARGAIVGPEVRSVVTLEATVEAMGERDGPIWVYDYLEYDRWNDHRGTILRYEFVLPDGAVSAICSGERPWFPMWD